MFIGRSGSKSSPFYVDNTGSPKLHPLKCECVSRASAWTVGNPSQAGNTHLYHL